MKPLVFLVLFCLSVVSATAAENTTSSMPSCNDPRMLELVADKISGIYADHPSQSILEKRNQQLTLRNLHDFSEQKVADYITPKFRNIANQIMTVKMNDGLRNEDLRLCRTRETTTLPAIYLLIHPQSGTYIVDILNFGPAGMGKEDYFIIYH